MDRYSLLAVRLSPENLSRVGGCPKSGGFPDLGTRWGALGVAVFQSWYPLRCYLHPGLEPPRDPRWIFLAKSERRKAASPRCAYFDSAL